MTAPRLATIPSAAEPFDHEPRTRIVFGRGTVDRVGELTRSLSARRVLLVTDPGIVSAGHAARVTRALETAGLTVVVFDRVIANPTTRCVEDCRVIAAAERIDAIVGLGGGSSLDTAKGCNFLLTQGGRMQDYRGVGKATRPMLPLVAIPTTAGTGSECQSFALITDETTHEKMACGDPKAAARIAILDPGLTLSQPPRVTADTGVDAIAHALETAVTRRRTALSCLYSQAALQLTLTSLPQVLDNPEDLPARSRMLLGAAWAGVAIENSMLGAAHAAANPLTAHHGIVHGEAVGMMLPWVVRFNAREPATQGTYADLARAAGLAPAGASQEAAMQALVDSIDALLARGRLPHRLSACGVEPTDLPQLAREAATQWTAGFNPRSVSVTDFEQLYEAAYSGQDGWE